MKSLLFSAALLLAANLSASAIVDLGSATSQTPYDRYMSPVKQTYASLNGGGATMDKVQALVREGRNFRYTHSDPYNPATPQETAAKRQGDCKDKALWLINQLNDPTARFVIGKEIRGEAVSHAWVMWQNEGRWWILDCTLLSKPIPADSVSINKYVPLYSWAKGASYRHTGTDTSMVAAVAAKKQAPVAAKKDSHSHLLAAN